MDWIRWLRHVFAVMMFLLNLAVMIDGIVTSNWLYVVLNGGVSAFLGWVIVRDARYREEPEQRIDL